MKYLNVHEYKQIWCYQTDFRPVRKELEGGEKEIGKGDKKKGKGPRWGSGRMRKGEEGKGNGGRGGGGGGIENGLKFSHYIMHPEVHWGWIFEFCRYILKFVVSF